jgi:16S rRNA (guanine527-N7)-methyltransferase
LIDTLKRLASEVGLEVSDEFCAKSKAFADLLVKWNATHSLTSFKNKEELAVNIISSIYPSAFLPPFASCLDVGSGAGFPAVPLALFFQDAAFTLTEPKGKKYAFLQICKIELRLSNITVRKCRVEEVDDKFDLVSSRAVGSGELLAKITANARRDDTLTLLYKGGNEAQSELGDNARLFESKFGKYILIKG